MMTDFIQYETSTEAMELVIDQASGAVFATMSATARMCDCEVTQIRRIVGDSQLLEAATVKTLSGDRSAKLLNEDQIFDCLAKYNPNLLAQCAKAGLRVFLYGLAGYEIKPVPKKQEKPALKIVPKKLKPSAEMRLMKQMLDFIPGLDESRKAAILCGHMRKQHPETAEMAQAAIAAIPSAPAAEKSFTPTEIGQMLKPAIAARVVNVKLIDAGLQESYRTASNVLKYKATESGAEHSVLTLESKADGTPTESLRWKESVVELLSLRLVAQ
jgi:hypothetical protein